MVRSRVGALVGALVAALVAALALGACDSQPSADSSDPSASASNPEQPGATPSAPDSVVEQSEERGRSVETTAPDSSDLAVEPTRQRLQGIDVSHHQGAIDWAAVAGDDIDFAYLKATEGTGFTDDRFVTNASAARREGIEVGGYHYYSLCSAPEPQASHFVDVLDRARTDLPPVVDLELIGNCDPPPDRATMAASVRTFIDRVEEATGRRVVVYFHPDFEATYDLVDDFDRRLWVRRVGARPPPGDWFIWQRNDAGSVAGVGTPVDIDVMRR